MSLKKKLLLAFFIIILIIVNNKCRRIYSYLVRKGDNLSAIASKFNVNLQELIEINQIQNPDLIYVNQELKIPVNEQKYWVRKGDSLWKIAERFAVKVSSLIKLNNITTPDKIYVGQELLIPEKESKEQYQLASRGQSEHLYLASKGKDKFLLSLAGTSCL